MKYVLTGLILALFFIGISCEKENKDEPPMSQTEIWDCYHEQTWDDLAIRDELIGEWQWIYTEASSAPNNGQNTENENMLVQFYADSTLQVTINGEITKSTTWHVIQKDGELFGLEIESSIIELGGRILICDNILEFNYGYLDLSDNYFRKVELVFGF